MAEAKKFKGKSIDELKRMRLDDLIPLLNARQRRTLKRGLSDSYKTVLKKARKNEKLKTYCRDVIILPEFVGKVFEIYNGKEWIAVTIQQEMIGHYLGEFSLTRKPVKHSAPGIGATRSSKYVPLK